MILVILTGGTIGSYVYENGRIDLGESKLIKMYENRYDDAEFESIEPVNVLSENIGLTHWSKLINAIDAVDSSKYEGIIIAHGSDTLAYTSALVGMLFGSLGLPVCLIAADYPLDDRRSNGIDNMHAAVVVIKSKLNGVWTIYADHCGQKRIKVYPATRLIEADTYNDMFSCYGSKPFGHIENDTFEYEPECSSLVGIYGKKINISSLTNNVLFIRPYPGLDYSTLDASAYSAVVHYSYHSGTACAEGQKNSLAEFCGKADKDIYFASLKSPSQKLYASSDTLLKSKLIPLYNISPYALYMKALIAYNQRDIEPRLLMHENLGGEILPPKE